MARSRVGAADWLVSIASALVLCWAVARVLAGMPASDDGMVASGAFVALLTWIGTVFVLRYWRGWLVLLWVGFVPSFLLLGLVVLEWKRTGPGALLMMVLSLGIVAGLSYRAVTSVAPPGEGH